MAEILVERGSAAGVRLASGEVLRAGTVLSNAHPKLTFLELLPEAALAPRLRRAVERIETKGSMARIHLLVDRLPHYVGFASAEEGPQHRGHAVLGGTLANFEKAHVAQIEGGFPDELAVELIIQSVSDPTLAPKGLHTVTLGVQHTPFALARGDWDSRREEWADLVLETVFRYAPNLRGHVLGRHVITPLDLERDYHLVGGNIFHVPMTLEYSFDSRPTPELGGYRTPVAGLYLCGAGTHPGGAVTGRPGRNAAHAVLADLAGIAVSGNPSAVASPKSFLDRLTTSEPGLRLGQHAARSPLLAPLVRYLSRNRPN